MEDSDSDSDSYNIRTENKPITFRNMSKFLACVDYKSLIENEETKEILKRENYEIIGKFNGENIYDSIKTIIDEVDNTEISQLIKEPSKNILSFIKLFNSNTNNSSMILSFKYPPLFDYSNCPCPQKVKMLHLLLVKMILDSKSPNKMMVWIITALIPNNITSYKENNKVLAASLIQKNPKIQYAILDNKKHLHIYEEKESKKGFKTIFDEKVGRFKVDNNNLQVVAYNTVGKESTRFSLLSIKSLDNWAHIYDQSPPPLLTFITKMTNLKPSNIYKGVFNSLVSDGLISVHALCSPGVVMKEDLSSLSEALIEIAYTSQNFYQFLHTILCSVFENPCSTVDFICSDECIIKYLAVPLALKTNKSYIETFGKEIVDLLEKEEVLDVRENPERVEEVFFICLDKILESSEYVSEQFKYICTFISNYINIRFNSVDAVVRIISSFFGQFFCHFLSNISNTNDKEKYNGISRMLSVAFNFGEFISRYNIGNCKKRLSESYYPKISKFVLSLCNSIGDIIVEDDGNKYDTNNLEKIINIVSSNNKAISNKIKEITNKFKNKEFAGITNPLAWSFAIGLSLFFNKANVNCTKGDELHAPAYPALLSLSKFFFEDSQGESMAKLAEKCECSRSDEIQNDEEEEYQFFITMNTNTTSPDLPTNITIFHNSFSQTDSSDESDTETASKTQEESN